MSTDNYNYRCFSKKYSCYFTFSTSSCNSFFNNCVEQFLIKELKDDQVVIIDNASFHKSQKN